MGWMQWVELTPEENALLDEVAELRIQRSAAATPPDWGGHDEDDDPTEEVQPPPAHQAHVLVAEEESALRHLWAAICESEGHHVTAPADFWGVIATLRSTLHPLVVVFGRDGYLPYMVIWEDRVVAFEALAQAMRQHAYVAMDWRPGVPLPARLRVIEEQLDVEFLHPQPLDAEALIAAVNRAAARLAERTGA